MERGGGFCELKETPEWCLGGSFVTNPFFVTNQTRGEATKFPPAETRLGECARGWSRDSSALGTARRTECHSRVTAGSQQGHSRVTAGTQQCDTQQGQPGCPGTCRELTLLRDSGTAGDTLPLGMDKNRLKEH